MYVCPCHECRGATGPMIRVTCPQLSVDCRVIRIVGNTRTPSHAHSPAFRFTDMCPPASDPRPVGPHVINQNRFSHVRCVEGCLTASSSPRPHHPLSPFPSSRHHQHHTTPLHRRSNIPSLRGGGEASRAQNPKLLANRCASFFGFLPSGRPSLNTGILAVAVAGCCACPFEPRFLTLCTAIALCLAQAICQSFAFGL